MNTNPKVYIAVLFLFISFARNSTAQELPPVKFEFGDRIYQTNIGLQTLASEILTGTPYNNKHYQWVQFDGIPNDEWRSELEAAGIEFLEYIPRHCYLLAIPAGSDIANLFAKGARSMQLMDLPTKIDMRIMNNDIPDYAFVENNIRLKLMSMPGVSLDDVQDQLSNLGGLNLQRPNHKRFIFLEAEIEDAKTMAMLPWVRYVELMDPDGVPESVEGRSMQRGNLIDNHLTMGGLSYNGDNIKILVRDDGDVGPHIDFQGRLWNDPNNNSSGSHGDGVAGVWAAAGNLDPTITTSASAADVYVIDYLSTFLDNTLTLHQDTGVVITNSSYSNGCNAGYTTTTVTVDEMVFENETLLHMFSAGNSNGSNCGYGAGNQWGNVTGGHKQGKNVIAVANLDRFGDLVSSSSRGPAHDGRVKPDLAGHGAGQISTSANNNYQSFGGTSAAAPSTAGNIAQLYHVYEDLIGSTPPSALIKAVALNSARDLGNAGPDYKYGWGLIDAGKAYETLANNQYFSGTVGQGETNAHDIVLSGGNGQVKIMVYWADDAASPSSSIALINDIDMTVTNPNSTTFLPLVLDETPDPVTLDLPALAGEDHLNNMEQVTLFSPAAGTYTLDVTGFDMPNGPREYFVVYSYVPLGVKVTYPLGGEKIQEGALERIHWDAYRNTHPFDVEYSLNNGISWNTIELGVDPTHRSLDWNVPSDVVSGECLVRVSRQIEVSTSQELFSIHTVPTDICIVDVGIDSALVSWSGIPGATDYNVYKLGNENMDLVGTTTGTSFVVDGFDVAEEQWFSVSVNSGSAKGQRAIATSYQFGASAGSCIGCSETVDLPFTEGFESGFGDFCNSSCDLFDWETNSGPTDSDDTGPSSAFEGTEYIYIEASGSNNPDKSANIVSPCINLTSCTSAFLKFNYHMYGADMGSLKVQISEDQGLTWGNALFEISGDQGDNWFEEEIDLAAYCGSTISFRFAAVTGDGFESDIAIDNIIVDGEAGCLDPLNLQTSVIGSNDATVAWEASSSTGTYEVELVDITAGGVVTGIPTETGIITTDHTFTGLINFNMYEAYVRLNCGFGESNWIGPVAFTTGCFEFLGNAQGEAIEVNSFPYDDTNSTDGICITSEYDGQASPDVFYKITTGTNTDSLQISTCNAVTDFNTVLYLLDNSGNLLSFNDDADPGACSFTLNGQNSFSILNANVAPLTEYYLVVDGFNSSSMGTFALHIDEITCASSLTINGLPDSGIYPATGLIISDALIESTKMIEYKGGDGVDLLEDFEVEVGAVFEANAEGCN